MKYIIAFCAALLLSGCSFNYKGVLVNVDQQSDVRADQGSVANASQDADATDVPDHQQGSDVAVPLVKELGKAYKRKLDVFESLAERCIKEGLDARCQEIEVPEIPELPTDPVPPVVPGPDPEPPVTSPDVPTPNASWTGGNLWKPEAETRGGVPVVLTKASAPQCNNLRLFNETDEIPVAVEYRGRTNGERFTYFLLDKRDDTLPKNLIVDVCSQVFLVPDPTQRYE